MKYTQSEMVFGKTKGEIKDNDTSGLPCAVFVTSNAGGGFTPTEAGNRYQRVNFPEWFSAKTTPGKVYPAGQGYFKGKMVDKEKKMALTSSSAESTRWPVISMWICMLLGWAFCVLLIPYAGVLAILFNFAAFVLAIACLYRRRALQGVAGLVGTTIVSFVLYAVVSGTQ